jgi:hypothetical protein
MTHSKAGGEPGAFRSLGLIAELSDAVTALGYEEPTPVQREAIPILIAGRDLLAEAATGTGKTAAFALPMLQRLAADPDAKANGGGLVLVPTRELAMQVAEAVHKYAKGVGPTVLPLYGGAPMHQQIRALERGAHVVVATPGRALDLAWLWHYLEWPRFELPQVCDVFRHLAAALITLLGVLGNGSRDDSIDFRGQLKVIRGCWHGSCVGYLVAHCYGTGTLERAVACNHVVKNHAQGKQIRTSVDGSSIHLFRRHIGDRADDRPAPRVEEQAAQGLAPEEGLDLAGQLRVVRVRERLRAHL